MIVITDDFIVNVVRFRFGCRRDFICPFAVAEFIPNFAARRFARTQQLLRRTRVTQIQGLRKFPERRSRLSYADGNVRFGNIAVVIVPKHLVVHGVFARVRCRGNIRRPSSVSAEFVLHCAAVGNSCRNQIVRTARIDKVFNCRGYRRKRGICTTDLKLNRLFRAVVVGSCRNRCFDKVTTCRGRNGFGKRSVGSRRVCERRRAELRRSNGHFRFFTIRPTFQRQPRDSVSRFGNDKL